MIFNVGDKVRVRKDLEVDKDYGENTIIDEMLNFVGKIVTIKEKVGCQYKLQEDKCCCFWTNEMLEPVEDIIEYKGKKYDVKKEHQQTLYAGVYIPIWENDLVLQLTEHKEEILDEKEKEYLRNVIKYVIEPTHNEVDYITKHKDYDGYLITINFKKNDGIGLPYFKDKRMYKGMELEKEYTLEDLGL